MKSASGYIKGMCIAEIGAEDQVNAESPIIADAIYNR